MALMKSRGLNPFTSQPSERSNPAVSKRVTGATPLSPASNADQKSPRPKPTGLTTPTPDMNTLFTACA